MIYEDNAAVYFYEMLEFVITYLREILKDSTHSRFYLAVDTGEGVHEI